MSIDTVNAGTRNEGTHTCTFEYTRPNFNSIPLAEVIVTVNFLCGLQTFLLAAGDPNANNPILPAQIGLSTPFPLPIFVETPSCAFVHTYTMVTPVPEITIVAPNFNAFTIDLAKDGTITTVEFVGHAIGLYHSIPVPVNI